MAQIDREGGNQSGLGEAFYSYNHSLTFKKKILDLFTHSNNHTDAQGEGGQIEGGQTERYNKEEELEHGVGRDFPKCSHSLF